MWRHETHGSFMLVLNTALHYDHLHAGRNEPASDKRIVRQYTIQQFLATTAVGGPSFSPDGSRVLFTSDASGIPNAYTVPFEGGTATPLTRSTTDSTFAVSFFPKDERILYTHDQGGDENNHLYVLGPKGETDLTPGAKLKAIFAGWSRDDSSFNVLTNERDPRFFDVYRYDAEKLGWTLIYKDTVGYQVADVSGDGRWVALDKPMTTADGDIYVWDTREGRMTHLTPHKAPTQYRASGVRPRLEMALLPDQCRRRVHPRAAVRAGDRKARRRRVGRLGHPVHAVLAQRPLPRLRRQRRRADRHPRA